MRSKYTLPRAEYPLPFVHGFCGGLAAGLVALAILFASATHAAPSLNWRRAVEVQEVAIEVRQVARLELLELLRKHDPRESLVPSKTVGFSLLKYAPSSGTYRCELYVLSLEDARTIEHETRHCHGWVHR